MDYRLAVRAVPFKKVLGFSYLEIQVLEIRNSPKNTYLYLALQMQECDM